MFILTLVCYLIIILHFNNLKKEVLKIFFYIPEQTLHYFYERCETFSFLLAEDDLDNSIISAREENYFEYNEKLEERKRKITSR